MKKDNEKNIKTENQSEKGSWKGSFQNKRFKNGAYSTIITGVVLAIVLFINLVIGELDLKIDLSIEQFYTLSEQTESIVSALNEEVIIYQSVQEGNEDTTFTQILEKYTGLSSNIKLIKKDPILYPTFVSQYLDDGATLTENGLIVVCGDRYKVVQYEDMLVQELDMTTYQYVITGLNVEGKVTEAIRYVTSKDIPVMYVLEGHGEVELGETIKKYIQEENIEIKQLNLISADSVPEDAAVILINAPLNDYSKDESNQIIEYLEKGNRAIILAGYSNNELPNFESILNHYGIELAKGIVVEQNSSYYYQGQTNILPKINLHDITTPIKSLNLNILIAISKGIIQSDVKRDGISITSLLTSSADSFSMVDVNSSTIEKSKEDVEGPFDLAVALSEEYGEVTAKMVVFGSYSLIDENILTQLSTGNSDVFLNSLNWLIETEEGISIRSKTFSTDTLSMTGAQVSFWAFLLIGIIPVGVLVAGGYVWFRRRKK